MASEKPEDITPVHRIKASKGFVIDERLIRNAGAAAEWAKGAAANVASEAGQLGKQAARSDLAKDAVAGAAVGAVVALPLPIVGPITGAVVGAAIGVFRNLTRKGVVSLPPPPTVPPVASDLYSDLLKLGELRDKGILSVEEFEAEKKKRLTKEA